MNTKNKKLKILYIDGCGIYGGACRSLSENLNILKNSVDIYILCPKGSANDFYRSITPNVIDTLGLSKFDNTAYSYYQGFRWLILIREILFIPSTFISIIYLKIKYKDFDIIHTNEITDIIPALLCKIFFKSKQIVHCRSIYRNKVSSFRNKLLKSLLIKNIDFFIAIDQNVKDSLPPDLNIRVINNTFSKNLNKENQNENVNIGKDPDTFKIGYVGSLSSSKGIDNLLKSVILLKEQKTNFHIYAAGSLTRKYSKIVSYILNSLGVIFEDYQKLITYINSNGLKNHITFLGNVNNIGEFYSSIDILCFPSKYNSPGRPVIEAAYFSKPSIVSVDNPKPDTLINNVTGIATKPNDDNDLSRAILDLAQNKMRTLELGLNAKKLCDKNFNPEINTDKIYKLYNKIIA